VRYVDAECGESLNRLLGLLRRTTLGELREQLLGLEGIGRETADSILLYAGNHPIFVVDAYARRVLARHGLIQSNADYDEVRLLVEASLEARNLARAPEKNLGHVPSRMSASKRSKLAQHYGEMHGLLVQLGKQHCHKTQPVCEGCPLEKFLPMTESKTKS